MALSSGGGGASNTQLQPEVFSLAGKKVTYNGVEMKKIPIGKAGIQKIVSSSGGYGSNTGGTYKAS